MIKKVKTEKEKKEIGYGMQLRLANGKNNYIRNIVNGRYFLARCNMIAEQLQTKEIKENIDGCPKSEEFLTTEYALQKMQAIMSLRNAHFAKKELMEDFKLTNADILEVENDYYNGKIMREEYDDIYKSGKKAEFVDSSKD